MLVVLAVGDVEADLVQRSAPAQQGDEVGIDVVPIGLHPIEKILRRLGNTSGVVQVDVESPREVEHRVLADILLVNPAQEVVQQAFAQRAAGYG